MEDFNMIKILEEATAKAQIQDPGSLRNSPIPTIADIMYGMFSSDEQITKYLHSGNITEEQINKVKRLATNMTDTIFERYPNVKNSWKEIWKESFKQALIAGMSSGGGRKRRKKTSVPKRYVPKQLSKKDKKKQARELRKSRRAYKKGKYHTRKKMKSFKSKVSPHIIKARKMYKVDKITPNKKLAKASKCKLKGLKKMFQKGQGAYFSSGSRPNQTGHSWGYARMASAITGGKASAVDFKIIQENCSKKSRAYKLAKKAYKKYKKGRRRVKQVTIGGRKKNKKRRRTKKKRKN